MSIKHDQWHGYDGFEPGVESIIKGLWLDERINDDEYEQLIALARFHEERS